LLAELREAQSALLHRMRRLEDEEVPALKTGRENGRQQIAAVDESVSQLAARVSGAEAKTGEALRSLQASLISLDEKVAQASPQIDQQELDARFAAIAENLSHEVDDARAALAGQLADVLGELRPEEMRSALGDLSKRIAAAERRHAQTIEAVSIEIKRLNESMERRLRAVEARNDDSAAARDQARELAETVEQKFAQMANREVAFAEHISEEVVRVADRLEARVALSEQRGADAIGQIGEQISIVAERLHERQDRLAADVSERLQDSEQRQVAHLNDALENLSGVLNEIEARAATPSSPVHEAMSSFADRLHAIEARIATPAPVATPEPMAPPKPPEPVAPRPMASFEPPPPAPVLDAEAIAHHHEALREVAAHLAAKSEAVAEAIAPDTIFVEDIEARFGREHADPLDFPSDGDNAALYRLADDPFADMNSEPSAEEDDDLFWSTGARQDGPAPLQSGVGAPLDEQAEDDALGMDLGDTPPGYGAETDYFADSESKYLEDEVFDRGLDLNLDGPRKDDYLSHARRVAKAQSDALIAEPSRARQPKGNLRGFSSLVLWTAAGAVAAALAGGAYYYTEQRTQEAKPPTPTRDALALPADAPPGSIAESAAKAEAGPEALAPAASDVPLSATPAPPPKEAAPVEPAPTRAAPLHPTSAPGSNAAAPTLTEAAARGDRAAQYQLALKRFDEARPTQAVALLKRSAEQGLAIAQYRLAKAFERGEGLIVNKDQARQWTEKAALGGNAKAMHDLGVYLASAQGPALDEAGAFTWFKRAAELGVADSQFNVAIMYLQGRGAAPDSEQAYYWFQVAASAGDHDAAARAAMLEKQLGASAKPVRARARSFSPRPTLAEANGVIDQSWAPSEQLQASASSGPRT
jgi:localization factor PodJL